MPYIPWFDICCMYCLAMIPCFDSTKQSIAISTQKSSTCGYCQDFFIGIPEHIVTNKCYSVIKDIILFCLALLGLCLCRWVWVPAIPPVIWAIMRMLHQITRESPLPFQTLWWVFFIRKAVLHVSVVLKLVLSQPVLRKEILVCPCCW